MPESAEPVDFLCRVCGRSGVGHRHEAREMMFGSRERFAYLLCSHCGSLQIEAIPEDLGRHYPPQYYSHAPRAEPAEHRGLKGAAIRWYCRSAVLRPNDRLAAALRRRLPEPGDFVEIRAYLEGAGLHRSDDPILDVGCGARPSRLAAMRRCGFTALQGLDPFAPADLVYQGVPVRKLAVSDMEGEGRFALVMFHHSLEHVPDPLGDLRAAARLLRPGGRCLVRIPVMGTYFWRRFATNWAELDAPRHLYLMTSEGLETLASAAGLRLRQSWFDSGGWEIAASLQYEADVPMFDPRACQGEGPQTLFDREARRSFDREAAQLNTARDGGRACFFFEKA